MTNQSEALDGEVLRLRQQGQAYARIGRDLGLERAADAQQAFRRAVRRLPEPDATRVRDEEFSRLDRLADRVRNNTSHDEADRVRWLSAIERMREQLRPLG